MTRLSIRIISSMNFGIKFLTLRNSWHETIWHAPRIHILSTWWGKRNHSNLWNPRWGNFVLAPTPELWTLQSEWRLPILGSLFLCVSEAAGFITTVCKDALRSFPYSFILRESNKFFPSCSLKSFLTMWISCSLTLKRLVAVTFQFALIVSFVTMPHIQSSSQALQPVKSFVEW